MVANGGFDGRLVPLVPLWLSRGREVPWVLTQVLKCVETFQLDRVPRQDTCSGTYRHSDCPLVLLLGTVEPILCTRPHRVSAGQRACVPSTCRKGLLRCLGTDNNPHFAVGTGPFSALVPRAVGTRHTGRDPLLLLVFLQFPAPPIFSIFLFFPKIFLSNPIHAIQNFNHLVQFQLRFSKLLLVLAVHSFAPIFELDSLQHCILPFFLFFFSILFTSLPHHSSRR